MEVKPIVKNLNDLIVPIRSTATVENALEKICFDAPIEDAN
jgi:hypothetical protein